MKRNGAGQKFLPFLLIAVMLCNMDSPVVLAETEPPEMAETAELPEEPEEPEPPTMSENTLTVSENSVTDIAPVNESGAASGLSDAVLEDHIVRGLSPKGAVVNLFDYWQYSDDHNKEDVWDWEYEDDNSVKIGELCNLGISKGHLLRFGLTRTGEEAIWDYGAWNRFSAGKPYQGIVQNTLGADGFPRLNFGVKKLGEFGNYVTKHREWLDENHRTESLAYLFSTSKGDASKAIYRDVQGLFQMDEGDYYYDSRKNFAEFDKANSRFILYDSPGVGTKADQASGSKGNFGEFFPFNKASEVFNTAYTKTDGEHPYSLSYTEEEVPGNGTGKTENPPSYIVWDGNASFLSCTYPALNHYIGMTLEVPFLQPVGGRLDDDDMIFEFSGDDDVWIFIDGVLVADLGGIHDAQKLTINFADGNVSIMDKEDHTLFDSFKAAGRSVDGFSGNTFADNTKHKLQMFYLERGHMASNLSLRFNVVVVDDQKSNDPGGRDPGYDPEEYPAETENPEEALGTHSDAKADSSAHPAGSDQGRNAVGPPRTGDDSLIGWWAVLSLISLLGIGATVCNMILKKRREKNGRRKKKRRKTRRKAK